MRLVDEHDLVAAEARAKAAHESGVLLGKSFMAKLWLPVEAYVGMLLAGGLHDQHNLHGVPNVSYLAALGVRLLAHIATTQRK